jgi:hypothetical protein
LASITQQQEAWDEKKTWKRGRKKSRSLWQGLPLEWSVFLFM